MHAVCAGCVPGLHLTYIVHGLKVAIAKLVVLEIHDYICIN